MLRTSIVALGALLSSGCFSADTRGAPCTEDEHCGVGFSCSVAPGAFAGRCGVAPSCPDFPLPSAEVVFANTAFHGQKAACTGCRDGTGLGAEAPDVSFGFEAPQSGTYVFRTLAEGEAPDYPGSSFPTVLYVLDGDSCTADEIAFGVNDRAVSGSNESTVAAFVERGDTVTVVVDGEGTASGTFALTADALDGSCPDRIVEGLSHLEEGDATAFGNTTLTSCGARRSQDFNVAFTASEEGLYLFESGETSQPAVVAVRDGARCDAAETTELGCGETAMTLPLDAGQEIIATIDGATDEGLGAFSMSIDRCATGLPDASSPMVTGTTAPVGLLGSMGPSCRPPDASTEPAVAAHVFTATVAGVHTFVVNPEDAVPAVEPARIAVREGLRCEGPELSCTSLVTTRENAPQLVLEAGDVIVVVIETPGGPGPYVLEIEEPA